MHRKLLFTVLVLSLSLLGTARLGLAQEDRSGTDPLTKLESEGWRIVSNGVLQRELRTNEVETFAFGVEGFTSQLREARAQLEKVQAEFKAHPSAEMRRLITTRQKEIASLQRALQMARAAEARGEGSVLKVDCTVNLGYNADAGYLTGSQGTWGSGSASFSTNCAGFSGEVYAEAIAKATQAGGLVVQTFTDGPRSGSSVSASAYASVGGGSYCESTGYGRVISYNLNPTTYTRSAANYSCPQVSNPSPTINGTNYIYVSTCVSTTWTSSVSGGTSPYSYQWTWNGVNVGTGSSYTRSICPGSTYSYTTNSLGLTVTDSGGRQGSTSLSVDVEKDPQRNCLMSEDGMIICPQEP
jgi:hypothetical protein